jgi:peptidoglycan/xylan/chitin deacetylase (PgdA/CDA1 family)
MLIRKLFGTRPTPQAKVLLYHRIDEAEVDPWKVCVTPENFERQLQWLAANCQVVRLEDLVDDRRAGSLKSGSVAITFDDGYLDNYRVALPLLEKYQLPATFFICTGNVRSGQPFWWDQWQSIALAMDEQAGSFGVWSNGNWIFDEGTGNEGQLGRELNAWQWGDQATSKRINMFLDVWAELKALNPAEQQSELAKYAAMLRGCQVPGTPAVMNIGELQAMSKSSLVSIGAHTVHHPALANLDEERQRKEMTDSKAELEDWLEQGVHMMAYPYGNYDHRTVALAKQAKFSVGVTTEAQPVGQQRNNWELGRYYITNDSNFSSLLNDR